MSKKRPVHVSYLINNACYFTTKDSLASYDWQNCSDPVENLEFFLCCGSRHFDYHAPNQNDIVVWRLSTIDTSASLPPREE